MMICDEMFLLLKTLLQPPKGTYKVSRAQDPSFVTPDKGSHVNYLATGANWKEHSCIMKLPSKHFRIGTYASCNLNIFFLLSYQQLFYGLGLADLATKGTGLVNYSCNLHFLAVVDN